MQKRVFLRTQKLSTHRVHNRPSSIDVADPAAFVHRRHARRRAVAAVAVVQLPGGGLLLPAPPAPRRALAARRVLRARGV